MAVLLALGAAASWGAADFLGGVEGRRSGPGSELAITVRSQALGLVLLAVLIPFVPSSDPTAADLLWGALAGIGGGTGVALLYRGLAVGRMNVIAPVTAAGAAVLPVLLGVALGEAPSPTGSIGVVVALLAIVLVSRADPDAPPHAPRAGLAEAIGAGAGFALVLISLDRTGGSTGLWPLLPMKGAAVVVVGLAGLVRGRSLRSGRDGAVLAIGVLDVVAIVAYLVASRIGLLPVVAVLGSLYPAGTVLLARTVLDERLTVTQLGGLALALVGVAMIALG